MIALQRCLTALLALFSGALFAADLPLEQIKLPPGFSIEVWSRVDNPRQMALGRRRFMRFASEREKFIALVARYQRQVDNWLAAIPARIQADTAAV